MLLIHFLTGQLALSSWDLSRSVEFQGVLQKSVHIILDPDRAQMNMESSCWWDDEQEPAIYSWRMPPSFDVKPNTVKLHCPKALRSNRCSAVSSCYLHFLQVDANSDYDLLSSLLTKISLNQFFCDTPFSYLLSTHKFGLIFFPDIKYKTL